MGYGVVRLVKFDDYAVIERRSRRNDRATYDDKIEGIMFCNPHISP